jgi:hypothetical protein
MMALASKENYNPSVKITDSQIEVHVKWEASKGNSGNFITTLKVLKDATLADLRKLIEIYLAADNQAFTFLVLGVRFYPPLVSSFKQDNPPLCVCFYLLLFSYGMLYMCRILLEHQFRKRKNQQYRPSNSPFATTNPMAIWLACDQPREPKIRISSHQPLFH